MSMTTYILNSCDGSHRYKVTFNVSSYLNVGDVWYVECGGMVRGCYEVLENTDEVLDIYRGDDCSFTEYIDCEDCQINTGEIRVDQPMALVDCYRWDRCDLGVGNIYTATGTVTPDNYVLYSGVCYQKTANVVSANETDLSLIPNTQFFDRCTSCAPIEIQECDVLFVSDDNELYSYTFSSDTSVLLATGLTYAADIAHTNDKLWVNLGSNIEEYLFSRSPFYLIYNRTITVSGGTSAGLCSTSDDNILIGGNSSTDYIKEIDITTTVATSTNLFQHPTDRSISGDIALTSDGKYIITTNKFNGLGNDYYISQYDSLGNIEFDVNITSTVTLPYGVFVSDGEIYICGNGNEIWHMDSVSPYTLTLSATTTYNINGASQIDSCVSSDFEPNITPTPTPTISITPTPTISVTPSVTVTPTISVTPSVTPTPSTTGACYIGTTNGIYRYTDCCGIVRSGIQVGLRVCFDPSQSYTGVVLSTEECTEECDNGPMFYTFTVTGTCEDSNGGNIIIYPEGGVLPYTIENNLPGSLDSVTGIGPFTFSGLSADTYTFTMNDSSGDSNESINININVEGCLTVTGSTQNETCGNKNGTFTVSGDSQSLPYEVYLYKDSILYSSGNSLFDTYTWIGLNHGEYYAYVVDYGGATAQTTNHIISSGSSVDFGFSYTGQSPCFQIGGAAEVTGVTGNSPFTYLWGDGQTGTTATGLTQGYNSLTVTDVSGCTTTKNVFIPYVSQLGIQSITTTRSNCFEQDGTAIVTVTGGTSPYYFSGSTGQSSGYISSNSYTLTGISGSQSVRIIDSGYCDITDTFTIPTTAGFTVVGVNTNNSNCSNNGSITIQVDGSLGNITYSITGSTGNTQTVTTTSQSHTFNGLVSDTYTVGITSNSGCFYSTTKEIINEEKFVISNTITDATCGENNGSVIITVSSGTTEIIYPLSYVLKRISDGYVVFSNVSSVSNIQFVSGLGSTSYELTVTDNNGCSSVSYFGVGMDGVGVQAIVYGTECTTTAGGTATIQVTQGTAPFTYQWSDNVSPSQINNPVISDLSGGTYSVSITDSNGCSIVRSVVIVCNTENIDDYIINTLCEQNFITTSQRKRGFYEMLNEAFLDLNQEDANCYLESAEFIGYLTISGGSYGTNTGYSESFYTTTDLNDVPSDNLWEETVGNLISNYTGITYSTDLLNNIFSIQGICEGDVDPTNGAFVELRVEIDLDVNCEIPPTPGLTPTPTPTPSITPTISVTPSPGSSPSQTPSVTPTVTNTPSVTVTPTITPTPSNLPRSQAILFILEQENNTDFATYMHNNGSTFYGFGLGTSPTGSTDIELFMDWDGWFDGTAPEPILQDIPQTSGGVDDFGNPILQYNFKTTEVPVGTASSAWYIWLIPQSLIGDSANRQTHIKYNINSDSSTFISQPTERTIYQYLGNYTGSNWVNDSYRMYTTYPGTSFSINNNDTDSLYFKGGTIG